MAFHKYQPYGAEFYEPILDYFINNLVKFKDEFDHVYFVDSNWGINPEKLKDLSATILKVDASLRYYDAYKEILPQVKEDLVLFMDDDTVTYKSGAIATTFALLQDPGNFDVATIYDTIGTYKTDKMNGRNKFCPYWFATKTELLKKYLRVDWAPHLPHSETLGLLTQAMLNHNLRPFEIPEDKSGIMFDGSEQYPEQHVEGGRGYYHIRSGSVPALLLAYKYNDAEKFYDYIEHQPRNEFLRQFAWYSQMPGIDTDKLYNIIVDDLQISPDDWMHYLSKFKEYHGLP